MSFAAPAWIGLAAVASLGIVAIHLIAWRLPRTVILPTARFVPDEPARRAARTIRLADIALLALRVAVVMIAGVAMARPAFESRPTGSATVIAVAAGVDSAARANGVSGIPPSGRTSYVVFDTTARVLSEPAELRGSQASDGHSLTVGLLAAIREARRLQQDYDTVRIALVAPFTRGSFDDATGQVRALWSDSIHAIRTPLPVRSLAPARVEFLASGDDPVVAGIRLAKANSLIRGDSRVVREGIAPAPDSGQAVVLWPRKSPNDSGHIDAVWAAGMTAIGEFTPIPLEDSGTVIARWSNGAPAAREVRRGSACLRAIGFDVSPIGDFVLSPSFQRLSAQLLAPCGGMPDSELASDSLLTMLSSPSNEVSASGRLSGDSRNRTAAIVMMLAMLLGMAELVVRRRSVPSLAGTSA